MIDIGTLSNESLFVDFYPIFSGKGVRSIDNFCRYKSIHQPLFQRFWNPLAEKIARDSTREERSRIVLFLVDQSCPESSGICFEELAPLQAIPQSDMQRWLKSDPVANWLQPRFGDDFADTLIEEFSDRPAEWNWQDPHFILDKMCFKFEIEGAILELDAAWKWAS